jgi:hypothetical protein
MVPTRRLITLAVAAAISFGSIGAPATAATSHWSTTQCQSWKSRFTKRNPHPNSKRRAEGNKVLKAKGCTQRV